MIDTSGHSGDLVFASEQALSVTETLTGAGHRVTTLPASDTARRPPGRRAVLAALRRVDGPRILHIAGHGRFDPQHPMKSGIPLGRQSLTARDFSELRLRCELVTVGTRESGMADRRPNSSASHAPWSSPPGATGELGNGTRPVATARESVAAGLSRS
ncbi:CHAT domain-containing protein [Streptomyces marianii]|uniref:CHAT domain-containing protein n=1 Tax=Streptomyces marianii TaxID=1817406 RepID=UPI002D78E44E|nr:CHAT domain-containing protein [Streptomyces marianii]